MRDLEDDSEVEFQIVGSQDANPMEGRISTDSPFGMSLLGHKASEIVTVEAPIGLLRYEILEIEN